MKKILLSLTSAMLLVVAVASFIGIYLKLDKLQEKVVYLEEKIGENTKPQDLKTFEQPEINLRGNKNRTNAANELSTHNTYVTTSRDGGSFLPSSEPIFTGASVPEVVRLDNGDLYLYFVDASTLTSPGSEQIAFSQSNDNGVTWSEKHPIVVTGKQNAGPVVDPSLVQLSDGSLRMYFYGATKISDPSTDTSQHLVYSAVSSDGLNFTVEDGVRFSAQKLTDPEVLQLETDYWVMYYALGQTTGIATSEDGLEFFDSKHTWTGGGVPGAYIDNEQIVHLYGCSQTGLQTASSSDGISFEDGIDTVALSGKGQVFCDPSPVLLDSGEVLLVYKQIDL